MRKSILAIVGLPGAGKSTAADYFLKKRLPIVWFGKIVNAYIDSHHLKHTKETHRKIWTTLRKKYGKEAFAKLNEGKLKDILRKDSCVVIDGLRSWEEYLYLKKKFPKTQIVLIAIYADKKIRYWRIAQRKYRSKLYGEDRDVNELIGTNMGPSIAFADVFIENNETLKHLYAKLDALKIRHFS